jgi:hypothetical protein
MEYLYIFRTFGRNCSHLKFGYTSESWNRFDQYRNHNPHIEIVYIAQLDNAKELEQEFHSRHQATFGREWYEEKLLDTMLEFINKYQHINCTNVKKEVNIKPNFKDTIIDFQKSDNEFAIKAFKRYTFLRDAIEKLGFKGIEELEYNATNIKRKLITLSKTSNANKIGKELELTLNEGQFYEYKTIKRILYAIYNKYIPCSKTTAKDIQNYYVVKIDSQTKNKVTLRGYTIVKKKLI